MNDTNPIAATLRALLKNQADRTRAALDGLDPALLDRDPGGGAATIRWNLAHMVNLFRFQLGMLGASADGVPATADDASVADYAAALARAIEVFDAAIAGHDPADWLAVPGEPRDGHWGDEPTLHRISRPFNDYVNHLGAVRLLRKQFGNPAGGVF